MSTLVLLSGGLDSAVLAAHEAQHGQVRPVYVSVGLAWELAELAMIDRLLAAPALARVDSLTRVEFTMRDVYPASHWAIRGVPPAYDTPDEDVYLTGRNLVLLAKAGVVAATTGATRIALGPLAGNPFPDARPEFFTAMSSALSLGLDHAIAIVTPFLDWQKEDVIRRGVELGVPLELTLSCMNPVGGSTGSTGSAGSTGLPVHCGWCSKCRERRDAFAAAGVPDPTIYANASPRT
ncbi:MAG: 7-cyano-7-deazaguanine synthase [Acidobacteriota bacterium]|nr:7-cyano-7-deazaguanine synthase [Acidobacteriota bacterium]